MPVEEAFENLISDIEQEILPSVILGSSVGNQTELKRLNITQSLQRKFLEVAKKVYVSPDIELVPYDPQYKLDEGQIAWISLEGVLDIGSLIDRISDTENLPLFENEPTIIQKLQFSASVIHVNAERSLIFFRQFSPKRTLDRSRFFGALFAGGAFDSVRETLFLFDTFIDCFTDGQFMFIKNVKRFEQIFGYLARLQACAEETVDSFLTRIPVHNAEEFRTACITQTRFMTKLASVSNKTYLNELTMAKVRQVIDDHNLEVAIVNIDGVDKIVFEGSRSKRWTILKLLDDDYLNSLMTNMRYEVNSKHTLG